MYYNNTKYSVDVPDQMARAYSVQGDTQRWPVAVFCNSLDLGWDQCPHLLQRVRQQQKNPEESPAAAGRGAEGRIHGGERGRGNQHKVGSSRSNHPSSCRHGDRGSAGPKELQTEPNLGHLKCHKPVCGNCVRRVEVICRLKPVTTMVLFCF